MALACPSCNQVLVGAHTDFQVPPWCPRCGADPKEPSKAQQLGAKAEDEKWDEKWAQRWSNNAAPVPTPPAPESAAPPVSPSITLRPRVSLVPRQSEEQEHGELLTEEPIPVLQPVRDEDVPVLERADDRESERSLRGPTPSTCLAHFHVRLTSFWNWSTKIHRVYVVGRDLLFVHLGVNSLDPEDAGRQTAASLGGGLIPALIGSFSTMRAREELQRLERALAAADEDVLRQFVAEEKQSFLLRADEIGEVVIEAASVWRKMFSYGCTALLTWRHAQRGVMKMELPTIRDVGPAVAEVQRLFGQAAQVNISWNSL
jgi:hypothetical protein